MYAPQQYPSKHAGLPIFSSFLHTVPSEPFVTREDGGIRLPVLLMMKPPVPSTLYGFEKKEVSCKVQSLPAPCDKQHTDLFGAWIAA